MKSLENYFTQTYEKIRYEDFSDTNDFHIQRIRFFLEVIRKHNNSNIQKYGQTLQNFLILFEKPIMLALEFKMVKSTIIK